ncbi:caspase family protein [Dactylosporangium sp. CA-092794]|uniref:caspase family protein n=1 Tax=Dactylosporangium sp. CA-092794 TaxID=3239929 RepID=UPI003D8BDDCF
MSTRRYRALLLGNARYRPDSELSDLRGPINDISQMAAVLTHEELGLFEPDDVIVRAELESREILTELHSVVSSTTQDDVLLIYYSGHGLTGEQSGSLLLCGKDTTVATAGESAVSFAAINDALARCPAAAVVIVLDCCNSGGAKAGPPDLGELAGQGRYILSATRPGFTARDATAVNALSLFTEHLVSGLWGDAAREHATDITVEDLYRHVYSRMAGDGVYVPRRQYDGHGDVVIGHAPDVPALPDAGVRRRTAPSAPAVARALGRWSLAIVLLLLILVGSSGFAAVATERAYRAQWEISGYVEGDGDLGLGGVFVGGLVTILPLALGLYVCCVLLTRMLGVAWWIPPAGLGLLAASGMFEGLVHYGQNTSSLFVPAAAMLMAGTVLRRSGPQPGRPTRPRVTAAVIVTAAVWLPCLYLGYRYGRYQSSAWHGDDALTFATLKSAMTLDRILPLWVAGVLGFAFGGLIAAWLLPRVPVLGGSARWVRRAARPWVRRTVLVAVLLTVVPTAAVVAFRDYTGRKDYGFDRADLHAFASPWFGYLDSCDGTDCVMEDFLGDGNEDVDISFYRAGSREDALDRVRSLGQRDSPQPAASGDHAGYTYWIGRYDGHDGVAYWTHESCLCSAEIRVHNNPKMYNFAVGILYENTDIPKPS